MTKSERLFYILELLKDRGAVHVGELADKCRVSERTIYRDIDSLLRMGIRIDYNNGYRLAPDSIIPGEELDSTDVSIIHCCLRSNPLYGNRYFKERIHTIEQKLLNCRKNAEDEHEEVDIVLLDCSTPDQEKTIHYEKIAVFFKAIQIRRKVRVSQNSDHKRFVAYIPVAIRFKDSDVIFIMSDNRSQAIEIPVSEVYSIELSTVHFDRRPVELIS